MKINVFFFISKFTFGGAGNAIIVFLKNLDKKKFNLHIFFLGNSELKKFLPKHVKCYQLFCRSNFFKTFSSFFEIKKILNQKLKKNKNKNVFISNIHYSNVLSIIFLRNIKNLKIILFERTSLKELDIFENFISFLKNKIVKFLIYSTYSKANVVLTNSKILSNELKNFNIKSKVIYSGLINKIIKPKKFIKKKIYKFIAVGRLTAQKDYFTLLRAIKLIKKKNFTLYIYGDGELKKKLLLIIKQNNFEKFVKLYGHEINKDKIYKNADLLIHTAIYEGLPNVIVEAMNYCVPVIASNGYGGTREILGSGKYGKLFEPRDHFKLSEFIQKFIIDQNQLNSKILNSRFLLKKFTAVHTSKKLEALLVNL